MVSGLFVHLLLSSTKRPTEPKPRQDTNGKAPRPLVTCGRIFHSNTCCQTHRTTTSSTLLPPASSKGSYPLRLTIPPLLTLLTLLNPQKRKPAQPPKGNSRNSPRVTRTTKRRKRNNGATVLDLIHLKLCSTPAHLWGQTRRLFIHRLFIFTTGLTKINKNHLGNLGSFGRLPCVFSAAFLSCLYRRLKPGGVMSPF